MALNEPFVNEFQYICLNRQFIQFVCEAIIIQTTREWLRIRQIFL